MIAFVAGILTQGGTEAVVTIGGGAVGLSVHVTSRQAEQWPPVGQNVHLWTHLVVREDSWTLYGFGDRAERAMFRLLISVTGVGPKLAMGMLSHASAQALGRMLHSGDEKGLCALPGIGRKSAARLVVELGQRVPVELGAAADGSAELMASPSEDPLLESARSVLGAMGLAPAQAERALLAVRRQDAELGQDLERWVRAALATL